MRRHRSSVIGILNGFDRVRIRGTLRWLCYVDGFGKYLSAMKVRLKDFKLYAEGITDRVRRATEGMAEEAGRARQDLGSFAIATALDELYGLGYAHTDQEDALYEAVTLDQVKAAAQKYLQPDALVIAVVKPAA